MPRLTKAQIHDRVVGALVQSGWSVVQDDDEHPYELTVRSPEGEVRTLRVYVWNLRHGGATRSDHEYRVQITTQGGLQIDDHHQTLMLGLEEDDDTGATTIVAFDPRRHAEHGSSPSVQVRRATVDQANDAGMAFESKHLATGSEIVVAMRPENFGQYIQTVQPEYHQGAGTPTQHETEAVEQLDFSQPVLTPEQLNGIPAARRRALRSVAAWLRDRNFCRRVNHVYGHACCMCRMQCNMVQASHIVPVHGDGSDEVCNGLALCPNHHDAFDRGLLAVDEDYVIRKNVVMAEALENAHLGHGLDALFESARVGEQIDVPDSEQYWPSPDYLRENMDVKGLDNFE